MRDPRVLAVIAVIIALPILAAAIGVSGGAGLLIGIVLVVGGLLATFRGPSQD